MWEMIWSALIFIGGIGVGRLQAVCNHSDDELIILQKLVKQEIEKNRQLNQLLFESEQKAETWERRYNALIPEQKEM